MKLLAKNLSRNQVRSREAEEVARSIRLPGPASAVPTAPATKVRPVRFLVVSLAIAAFLASQSEGEVHAGTWLPEVQRAARELDLVPDPALVRARPLELATLPVTAVVVELIGVAPPPQFTVVDLGTSWHVVTTQKSLTPGWEEALKIILRGVPTDVQPSILAEELTRLLVDPNPRFGVVIASWSDIPLEDELSDLYRDAKRRGDTAQLVNRLRRAEQEHGSLASPTAEMRGEQRVVSFFTWDFFGGEVYEWTARFGGSHPCISRELVATRLGSYKLYY